MITGIDETGDFRINGKEYCYFVGVHLDQNKDKLTKKCFHFTSWERSIPDTLKKKNGEIKAKDLDEKYLESFYFEVLEPAPRLSYSVVKCLPVNNPESLQVEHKQLESAGFERAYKQLEKEGNTRRSTIYKRICLWHRQLPYDKFLKLRCLCAVLGLSFNRVFACSQYYYFIDKRDDTNLKNIQFKIDKDFIKTPHSREVWNELFRHFWFDYTQQFGTPIIDFPNGVKNPIENYFTLKNGRLQVQDVFGKNTNFLDSSAHFEIRIADLIAYIFHRYENKKKCQTIGKLLLDKFTDTKYQYHELELGRI